MSEVYVFVTHVFDPESGIYRKVDQHVGSYDADNYCHAETLANQSADSCDQPAFVERFYAAMPLVPGVISHNNKYIKDYPQFAVGK